MPGARNSGSDKAKIEEIQSLAGDIQDLTVDLLTGKQPEPAIVMTKATGLPQELQGANAPLTVVMPIKANNGVRRLRVLGVPYGSSSSKDVDGQWFDEKTKFHLDRFPLPPAVYYHGFEAVGRPSGEPVFIGKSLSHSQEPDGVWFQVELDASEHADRVWQSALKGNARASSGSVAHLTRVSPDGHIKVWPVAELSIFETEGGKRPANHHAVAVPIKSLSSDFQRGVEALEQELAQTGAEAQSAPADGVGESVKSIKMVNGGNMEQEIKDMVAASVTAALKEKEVAEAQQKAQQEAVAAQISEALKAQKDALSAEFSKQLAEANAGRRLPSDMGLPVTAKFGEIAAYDDCEIADLAVMAGILTAAKSANRGSGPSEALRKAIAIRIADSDEGKTGYGAAKSAMLASGMALKSDELNRSTLASYGDEWISVAYSAQMWDKIRLGTQIVAKLPTVIVPQGAESVIIPIQSASPTFYTVAQTTDQAANPGRVTPKIVTSRMGTGQVQLTVNKLGAAVNYTGELEEDSLIPWASELRRDLTEEASEVLEHIVIDGDTAAGATTNINCIGGTPGGTEAYMLLNGFRKLALVTNTANSRSAGTFEIGDFLSTVQLMGLAGKNAFDKTKISFLIDMWTSWKTLELAEVKTRDVFSAPTIENGSLANIFGYPVIVTPHMHRANQDATYGLKANTSGKIDLNTASNNTTGSILAVRWDQWRFGMKRRMAFEVARDPLSDSTLIVCTMRVGMLARDNEAAAISYNVTL